MFNPRERGFTSHIKDYYRFVEKVKETDRSRQKMEEKDYLKLYAEIRTLFDRVSYRDYDIVLVTDDVGDKRIFTNKVLNLLKHSIYRLFF